MRLTTERDEKKMFLLKLLTFFIEETLENEWILTDFKVSRMKKVYNYREYLYCKLSLTSTTFPICFSKDITMN